LIGLVVMVLAPHIPKTPIRLTARQGAPSAFKGASTVAISEAGAAREKLVLKDIGLQAR
jgi:hypothetical protein